MGTVVMGTVAHVAHNTQRNDTLSSFLVWIQVCMCK
jgi:hypothetical protein